MIKKLLFICLVVAAQQLQAQVLEIQPKYPQMGKEVVLIYRPSEQNAALIKEAKTVNLVFTSSTFYNLPWELKMTKNGNAWRVSFNVPAYATFASFYFQSGKLKDRPLGGGDFSLAVYQGTKRVKDSFFHESYSIKTQMPKSPDLLPRQIELLRKEIAGYPDNFEAKVRLNSIEMSAAKTPAEADVYRNEARNIIHGQFEAHPDNSTYMARIAMAFAMIGEGYRTDSLKKIVIQRYPESDAGRLYLAAFLAKQSDSVKMINQLETMLSASDLAGSESSIVIHKILFKHALSVKDAEKAVEHARKSLDLKSPYFPRDLWDISLGLTTAGIYPDTAYDYAVRSFKLLDKWPVGNIRNLPGFGYVLPYVEDSVRNLTVREFKGGLLSLMGLNKLYIGDKTAALKFTGYSLAIFENRAILLNSAMIYEICNKPKEAYACSWKYILKNPFDAAAIVMARRNFLRYNKTGTEFDNRLQALQATKTSSLTLVLKKQLLNKPQPELNGLTDLNGKAVNMDLLKGKVVVMDFWATWCVPCMKELPYLQKVYNKYKDNPGVVFMVINSGTGNTIDDAKTWAKKNSQYTFPLYFNNDKKIGEKVGFSLIPTVVLLDKSGKMQFRTVGFEGAEMETKLIQQIEILLKP